MTAVLPGTTLARSAALAHAIRAELHDLYGDSGLSVNEYALLVAVDGLLTLARQGHGAPVVERILAEVAETLGIIEGDS